MVTDLQRMNTAILVYDASIFRAIIPICKQDGLIFNTLYLRRFHPWEFLHKDTWHTRCMKDRNEHRNTKKQWQPYFSVTLEYEFQQSPTPKKSLSEVAFYLRPSPLERLKVGFKISASGYITLLYFKMAYLNYSHTFTFGQRQSFGQPLHWAF